MSPEPNEMNGANGAETKKAEGKKKGKMNPLLLYGIGFLGSFGLVFASTFFYVTKVQQPKMAEEYAAEQLAVMQADSLEALREATLNDTTNQTISENDTTQSDIERREAEYRELERMRLVEQVSILRDRLEQSQSALEELSGVAQMNDSLFSEYNELKGEYQKADEELKFLKETLPGNMDKLMETIKDAAQNTNNNAGVNTMAASQPPVPQQQAEEDEGKGLRKLAKIYGNMKPKEASAIMENMSDAEVVDIMIRMRDRDAAAILTAFADKARAAKISRLMQTQ